MADPEVEFLIPSQVQTLFGEAPLLRGEDDSIYYTMMQHFARLVQPKDMLEWWWVKDITDQTWEIRRLRRFKVLVVELQRDMAVKNTRGWETLLPRYPDIEPAPVPESEKDSAEFFTYRLDQYKGVDKLIASAEQRRDRTLRQIERRRESLARRLRKASDEIVESNVADLPRAA